MNDLTLAQESDRVIDIRVIRQTQDIVIGHSGLLLGSEVLGQVGDHIALDRHRRRAPGEAGGGRWVYAGGTVHKVGVKAGGFDLLLGEIAGELMDNGADHLQVAQLLRADVGQKSLQLRVWHGISLRQIPQRRAKLSIGSAILQQTTN